MSTTKIILDRQASAKTFDFGTSSASGEGLLTINKGTAAATTVVLDVKGSQNIAGDLNLTGNLKVTGSIDTQTVTNTNVTDVTITLNDGGTTPADDTAGVIMEGTSNTIVGALKYKAASATKWSIGDGTTQQDIVGLTATQSLTGKSVNGVTLTTGGSASNFLAEDGVYRAVSASTFHRSTTVTGTQDSANKVFTIGNAVSALSEQVFLNGQLLMPGASNDYVISGTTVTFQAGFTAPAATDVIRVYGNY